MTELKEARASLMEQKRELEKQIKSKDSQVGGLQWCLLGVATAYFIVILFYIVDW